MFLWTTTSVFNKNTGAKKIAALESLRQQQAEQIVKITEDKQQTEQMLYAARNALDSQESDIVKKELQQENMARAYEQKIAQMVK